ncbi:HAMP domain-containing histidine kinase [Candidatus Dojkabacteria bacterium]|nr:HAMP domain-containing histidine kinase [Candidatus Dojkabacteria bacterium]
MKIFKSIISKFTIGIVLTVLIVVTIVGVISTIQINQGFDTFIQQQNREGYGSGSGKYQDEDEKSQRHQEIIDVFQNKINSSIFIASGAGLFISVVVGVLISRQIVAPINLLSNQIDNATRNNFSLIKKKSNTLEIDKLTDKFNELVSEINRIEKLRDELVSDVTHELKTPLTKIKGQIEGCIDGVYKCEPSHLQKTLMNVDQLENLISQMQKLIQLKARKYEMKKEFVELKKFVDSLVSGYSKNNLSIINQVSDNVFVLADKSKLREILDNLLSNAVNNTESGSVTIDYSDRKITVSDTGKGIDKKDLPYIFERFYRADKSRSKKTGGLGLGLSIVKELVKAHGWSISVISKSGKGSQFIIENIKEK